MLIPTPELFAHPSDIHGQRHVGRVMIHAFRLIEATGWTHLATPLWGSVYLHDLARTHDGRCLRHGADAVERWRTSSTLADTLATHGLHFAGEPGVQRAVTLHCKPNDLEPDRADPDWPLVALLKTPTDSIVCDWATSIRPTFASRHPRRWWTSLSSCTTTPTGRSPKARRFLTHCLRRPVASRDGL